MNREKVLKETRNIIGLIYILISIFAINYFMPEDNDSFFQVIELIFLIIISFYSQLIIHELGHLVFGKLTGYKLISFRIGSFAIVNKNGDRELKRYQLRGTGGQCLMSPPDLDDKDDFPVILYNFGGIIMNIFASLLFLIIFLNIRNNSLIKAGSLTMVLIGLYLAFLNGIPMKVNNLANDGYNGLYLQKNTYIKKAFWCQLKINEGLANDKKLKEMDERYFIIPKEADRSNHLIVAIDTFRIIRLMEENRFKEAKLKINNLLDKDYLLEIHKKRLKLEGIYIDMIMGESRETIYGKLDENFRSYLENNSGYLSTLRFIYSYELLINNSIFESNEYLNRFNEISRVYPYRGDIEREEEFIHRANERYKIQLK